MNAKGWMIRYDKVVNIGAGGGTRTPTGIRPTDFKSDVSTIPPRPQSREPILRGSVKHPSSRCDLKGMARRLKG